MAHSIYTEPKYTARLYSRIEFGQKTTFACSTEECGVRGGLREEKESEKSGRYDDMQHQRSTRFPTCIACARGWCGCIRGWQSLPFLCVVCFSLVRLATSNT